MWFIPLITMLFVMFAVVNYGMIEEPEPRPIVRLQQMAEVSHKQFKNYVAPNQGTLRLTKGVATQVHHSIKSDSVVMLTRKSMDGRAGLHLVVKEIIPNEKFLVEALDEDANIVRDDCGELYFVVL